MASFEIISATRDIILILGTIITVSVAREGLKSWSQELKGKADFDVARNLIRATYKLRDEIRYCRSLLIQLDEFPDNYNSNEKTPIIQAKAYSFIYENRWKPVSTALQDFETQSLETEALWGLWGSQFKPKTDELRQCACNLQVSIEAMIKDKANGGENFRRHPDFEKEITANILATDDDSNPLTLRISKAIQEIESEIRLQFKRS